MSELLVNSLSYIVNSAAVRKNSTMLNLLYTVNSKRAEICLPFDRTFIDALISYLETGIMEYNPSNINMCKLVFQLCQCEVGLRQLDSYVVDNIELIRETALIELCKYDINLVGTLSMDNIIQLCSCGNDLSLLIETVPLLDKIYNSVRTQSHKDMPLVSIPKSLKYSDKYFSSSYYNDGDDIFPSEEELQQRLNSFTEGICNKFTYENYAIAGGSISLILNNKLKYPKSADIDVFVWGTSHEQRIHTIQGIIQNLPSNHLLFQNKNVITVLFRNKTRNLQIINSGKNSLEAVLQSFDNDVSKMAYNGQYVCMLPTLAALKYQVCTFSPYFKSSNVSRMHKQAKRGYMLRNAEEEYINCNEVMCESDSVQFAKHKYLYITNEKPSRVEFMMQRIFSKNYKFVRDISTEEYVSEWTKCYRETCEPTNIDTYSVQGSEFEVDRRQKVKRYILWCNSQNCAPIIHSGVCDMRLVSIRPEKYKFKIALCEEMLSLILSLLEKFKSCPMFKSKSSSHVYDNIVEKVKANRTINITCHTRTVPSWYDTSRLYRGSFNFYIIFYDWGLGCVSFRARSVTLHEIPQFHLRAPDVPIGPVDATPPLSFLDN